MKSAARRAGDTGAGEARNGPKPIQLHRTQPFPGVFFYMTNADAIVRQPLCPRCRYDLAGVVASWSSACPCAGVCSECGLDFLWPDLLRADRQVDRTFIEHAARLSELPRAAFKTWRMALYPRAFWNWIRLHHEIRPRRMLLWLLLITLPLYIAHGALSVAALYAPWFFLTPAQARVVTPSRVALGELISAWTQPFFFWPDLSTAGSWARMLNFGERWFLPGELWPPTIRALITVQLAWVVLVAVLPQTRAASKVHRRHIYRAAVYQFAWLPLLIGVACVLKVFHLVMYASAQYFGSYQGSLAVFIDHSPQMQAFIVILALWTLWWWYEVIVRHWRLRRGRVVWCVLLIPVALSAWIAAIWP
jgi:hypothetical protein